MNSPTKPDDDNILGGILPDDPKGREEALKKIIQDKETEENLKKLAKKLSAEWKDPGSGKPDLSFARFEAKRRSKGQ
jgi:hypothetical protein